MKEHSTAKTIVSYFVRALGIFLILFTAMAAILGFGTALKIGQEGSTGIRYSNPEFSDYSIVISSSEEKSLLWSQSIQMPHSSFNCGFPPG